MASLIAFTEAVVIGLHSIVLIGRSSEILNVTEISTRIKSSRHHVAKILQRLAKEGFISSNRGPSGGFTLAKKPENITMLDIYEAIEGKFQVHACPADKDSCPFGNCLMGDFSFRFSNELREFLASKTLQSYLG